MCYVLKFERPGPLKSSQMVKEAAKKIDDQLFDLAAATYASEIAEAILIAIIPTQPAVEGQVNLSSSSNTIISPCKAD